MDPILISLITAAVGALVGFVAPKVASKTKNTVDDRIVAYVREHLPDIVRLLEDRLRQEKKAPRPQVMDHRKGK